MRTRHGLVLVLLAVVLAFAAPAVRAESVGVYVKLFPGKEFCMTYEAFRDPEGDPVLVSLQHRCLDPRLISIKLAIYRPSTDFNERGPAIPVHDDIDTFGDTANLYFEAAETGTYTICFRTPSRQPVVRFDMRIAATNDIVQPPIVDDEAVVVDKTTSMEDYANRLHMLDVCVDTTVTELRMYQMRRFLFDHTTNSLFYMVVGATTFNALLALGIMWWSEKYLERYFVKQKLE